MSINVVMPIYSAHTGMIQAQKAFSSAAESISSGINSVINPTDTYVASGLDTGIREANKTLENIQYGNNFTNIADSTLANINESLLRIRDLTLQASNGVYSDSQIAAMQEEINQQSVQIQQTIDNATFNGKKTINAITPQNQNPVASVDFMVTPQSSQAISYDPNIVLGDISFDVSNPEAAKNTLTQVDMMISDISAKRGEIGAVQSSFDSASNQLSTNIMPGTQSLSDIQDSDYVSAILELKKSQFSMEAMAKVMKTVMNSERYVLDLLK